MYHNSVEGKAMDRFPGHGDHYNDPAMDRNTSLRLRSSIPRSLPRRTDGTLDQVSYSKASIPSVTVGLEMQSPAESTNGTFNCSRGMSLPFKKRKMTPSDGQSRTSHHVSTAPDDSRVQSGDNSSAVETAIRSDPSHLISDSIHRPQSIIIIPVKCERSPSPNLSLGPKAVTQGSICHAPLPECCRRGDAHYASNRKAWVKEQLKKLKDINPDIRPTRVFTRADGMAIDWQSPVPVMSDTLLPAAPLHTPVSADRPTLTAEIIDIDKINRSISRQRSSSRMQGDNARPPAPVRGDRLVGGGNLESAAHTTVVQSPVRHGHAGLCVLQPVFCATPEEFVTVTVSENSASVVAVGSRSPNLKNPMPTPVPASQYVARTTALPLPRRFGNMQPGSSGGHLPQRFPAVNPMNRDTTDSIARIGSPSQSEGHIAPKNGQPRAGPSKTPSNAILLPAIGSHNVDMVDPLASILEALRSEAPQDRIPASDMTEQLKLEHRRGMSKPLREHASHGLHLPRKILTDASKTGTMPSANAQRASPDPSQAVYLEAPDAIVIEVNFTVPSAAEKEFDEKLKAAALQYLRRYIVTYDKDRSALSSAYSRTATFSKQTILCSECGALRSIDRPDNSSLKQGRSEIMADLLSLPDDRNFCLSGPRHLDFDVVSLGTVDGVLLMCHTGGQNEKWGCDQRFVLRQKEWDKEDQSTEGLWPLVAVSHQMTIRQRL